MHAAKLIVMQQVTNNFSTCNLDCVQRRREGEQEYGPNQQLI